MNVQLNTSNTSVDWNALLDKLEAASKAAEAQGVSSGANVTITATVGDVERTITIPVPDDLEIPDEFDPAAIESLCGKLDSLDFTDEEAAAFRAALGGTVSGARSLLRSQSSSSKAVLFDLYKLMSLLVEVGQKQRDAMRELRQAQSQQIQTAIHNQAETQRDAAWTSMWAGLGCCLLQVAVSGFMLWKQGAAAKQQMGTLETTGVSSAKENLSMLEVANSKEASAKQLQKVQDSVGNHPDGDSTVRQRVEDGFGKDAIGQFEGKLNDLDAAKAKLQRIEGTAKREPGDVPPESDLGKAEKNLADFKEMKRLEGLNDARTAEQTTEMQRLQGLPELQNKTDAQLQQEVDNKRAAVTQPLRNQITTLEGEVSAGVANYRQAVTEELDAFQRDFKSALETRSAAENPTPEEKAQLDENVKLAGEKLRYARAFAYDKLARPGVDSAGYRRGLLLKVGREFDAAKQTREADVGNLSASRNQHAWEARLGIVNAIGNVLQNVVSSTSSIVQAGAKEDEAEQAKVQEELDQTKDLFSQAQDLVDAVLQLMQAVSSAETQSMRDAIQA